MAYAEGFVVDEDEVVCFVVDVARHEVEAEGKKEVWDFVVSEEAGVSRLGGVVVRGGVGYEEAAVVERDVQVAVALGHDVKQFFEFIVQACVR